MKNILINDKERLLEGFLETCEAVGKTMGSEGSFAIFENEIMGIPIVTKDGISVAKSMYYKDKHKSMGNFLAKQAALQTVALVGDATTTSLVLAKAIVLNAMEPKKTFFGLLETEQPYNKKIEEGFEVALSEIKSQLKYYSEEAKEDSILRIATVSANNNKEIGKLILKAYKAVGKEGIINFKEDRDRLTTDVEITNGMLFNKGWVSPLLRNQNNGNFEGDDVNVIVYNGYEIGNSQAVEKYLNSTKGQTTLIIVERIADEDFIRRIASANQNGFNVTVVECPFYDVQRELVLGDIALYTGGEVFIQGTSEEVFPGKADRVVVTYNSCSIVKSEVNVFTQERIAALEEELKTTTEKNYIKARIQMLKGVAATILAGGITDVERKERFDLIEDAVHAVKAATEEGWLAGGGSTFLHISKKMKKKFVNEEIQFGYDVIKKAIQAPFEQICENANRNPEDYKNKCNNYGYGYNALNDEVSDLIDDGVIDSTKSLRVSLENALSVSKLLLNTKVVISLPENERF